MRDIYLKGILLITKQEIFTRRAFSSQHKRDLPEGHSPHHNIKYIYLKGIFLFTK